MAPSLPSNVHVSAHPCLRAKLSQFRSTSTSPRENKPLVHEIASIIGCEALGATLKTVTSGTVSLAPCPSFSRARGHVHIHTNTYPSSTP
jgi:uracil phosphoribosyltransferase